MSDPQETIDDLDDASGGENWRRKLERERKEALDRAEAAESRLARLERTEAFRAAGIDPSSKMGSYFAKGYEGDLTTEAIQAEAREVGLLAEGGAPPLESTQVPPVEAAGHASIDQAMQGARPPVSDLNGDMLALKQAVASGQISPGQAEVQLNALLAANGVALNAS